MDIARVARYMFLIPRLPAAWAVTAMPMPLNLWTTSHRLHVRERDSCRGAEVADSLVHYLFCEPLRLIAGVFDETWESGAAAFYGIGPLAECPVVGAIPRYVFASAASHSEHVRRRDEGVWEFSRQKR